jgi:hypothetical protein
MGSRISARLRRLVAVRAENLCEYCLIHEEDTFLGCQLEHIISLKYGGQSVEATLAFACAFCNQFKGSDIATISSPSGKLCRLVHPRTDRWSNHFRLDGLQIVGISDIGRATAELLAFNGADRLLERQALLNAGRYPSKYALKRMKP